MTCHVVDFEKEPFAMFKIQLLYVYLTTCMQRTGMKFDPIVNTVGSLIQSNLYGLMEAVFKQGSTAHALISPIR